MKIVDKMKDESLGSAILYNFTKGYGHVPMNVYDIVLPLMFNDDFRNCLSKELDVENALVSSIEKNENFIPLILQKYEELKNMTNKALGLCMIQQYLSFDIIDGQMKGCARESSILELNEVIALGKFFQGMSLDDILEFLKKKDMRIVCLDSASLGDDIDLSPLQKFGKVFVYRASTPEEVLERIEYATIILVNKCQLSASVLAHAKNLQLICVCATGVNNVDIDYCHKNHIQVCNVKGYSSPSVAQHTFALLLDLYNKNHEYHEYVASKEYCQSPIFTHYGSSFHELKGKVWTIVGLGAIGLEVAHIASAFGCKVQYFSASGQSYDVDYPRVEFDEMLEKSDIITIHAPLNQNTYNLFNKDAFARMNKNCFLINVGRGGIVNEDDLVEALREGMLEAAALDVFEIEPLPQDSQLFTIDNPGKLLLTPHIAWATIEARNRLFDQVISNISSYFENNLKNAV